MRGFKELSNDEYEECVGRAAALNNARFNRPPVPGEEGFEKFLDAVIRTLDFSSSTGLGEFKNWPTIGEALGWNGIGFSKPQEVDRLKRSVRQRLSQLAYGLPEGSLGPDKRAGQVSNIPTEDLQKAYCEDQEIGRREGYRDNGCYLPADPIKLFIKDEPHSRSKVEEGRFRLIHCLSLEDQIVDRLLFYPWVGAELRDPMAVMAKAGWAPLPAGYQAMDAIFNDRAVAVDKTAWDWTMPEWVVRAYVDVKLSQIRNSSPLYEWLVWRRLWYILGPGTTFRMYDGRVYRQTYWGLMKSGWFLTLSMNSMAQGLQHILAWRRMGRLDKLPQLWAMGDDTVLTEFTDHAGYWRALETTGCIVKKVETSREFAGFRISGSGPSVSVTPLYPDKHRFVLKYVKPELEQEVLLSYSLIYALSSDDWFHREAAQYAEFPIGPMQRMWAKGLSELKILSALPSWTSLD